MHSEMRGIGKRVNLNKNKDITFGIKGRHTRIKESIIIRIEKRISLIDKAVIENILSFCIFFSSKEPFKVGPYESKQAAGETRTIPNICPSPGRTLPFQQFKEYNIYHKIGNIYYHLFTPIKKNLTVFTPRVLLKPIPSLPLTI